MFTVVIAQQAYMDKLKEFKPYLKPYLSNFNVAYCTWFPEAQSISEAVPELNDTVAREKNWRAVIICDETGLHRKNPFLTVPLSLPKQKEDEDTGEYLEKTRELKFAAFEQAAKQPFTKLVTYLHKDPLISGVSIDIPQFSQEEAEDGEKILDYAARRDYLQYNEYLAEAKEKERLRAQIRDGSVLRAALPKEVICIAKRTYTERGDEIRSSWSSSQLRPYSRFYDWNLYFDKMRYLVFDILPKSDNSYTFDCLRFMNAVAILASNDTPSDALQPNTVYRLICDVNEDALQTSICTYDAKMSVTADSLLKKIQDIKTAEKPRLTDAEAQKLFCVSTPISVNVPPDTMLDGLTVSPENIGLATDCPEDEATAWTIGFRNSQKAFLHFMKQPRRSLKQAAEDVHCREYANFRQIPRLNEFQLEDIREHTQDEELQMISTDTCSLYDVDGYLKELSSAGEKVKEEIGIRMRKKQTVAIGAAVLLCCLICFLPMLFSNVNSAKAFGFSLLLTVAFLAIAALTAWVVLLCIRAVLKKRYGDYNNTVMGIRSRVNSSMQQYAACMTHSCNVLRGNSVINYRTKAGDPDRKEILVLRKHISDIEESRSELYSIFGMYLREKKHVKVSAEDCYDYDFSRPEDYEYPIVFSEAQATQVEFFQPDAYVSVPIDFVRRMSAGREELYD